MATPSAVISEPIAQHKRQTWEPLLDGSLKDRALESAAAIAADLSDSHELAARIERLFPHSMAHGDAGIALFLHYWDEAVGDEKARRAMEEYLGRAQAGLARSRMAAELFRGYAGVSWVIQHIRRQRGCPPHRDTWKQIDLALEGWVKRESTSTELLQGLGGALLYVAEHGVRQSTERVFAEILARLVHVAKIKGRERAWPVSDAIQTDYEAHLAMSSRERFLMSEEWRSKGMTGYYKLSAAHGSIGTAGALASAIQAGFGAPEAEALAASATEFVLEQELPLGSPSIFPNVPGTTLGKWTGGWCDGDAGIAAILLHIAQVLGREDLRAGALRIARLETTRRVEDVETANRRNYMLCHGSSGRAHIFNRLYQATGESQFAETAVYWFDQALALRTPGQGTGGFLVDEQRADGALLDVKSFLMGASGLGLALTAACYGTDPQWDRLLVLSGWNAQ